MTEINRESTSMVWLTLGSRKADELNPEPYPSPYHYQQQILAVEAEVVVTALSEMI